MMQIFGSVIALAVGLAGIVAPGQTHGATLDWRACGKQGDAQCDAHPAGRLVGPVRAHLRPGDRPPPGDRSGGAGGVRAIVLESVVDHSISDTGAFLSSQAWALQDSFDAFVAWCDADGTCALHGQDVRALYAGLLAKARAGQTHSTTRRRV